MNPDRCVELRLGCAAVKRDGQALNDLSGVGANHVATKDAVCGSLDNEFHHRPFVAAGERELESLNTLL